MSLLLSNKQLYTGKVDDDSVVKVRITIKKSLLSVPYELGEGTEIEGKIDVVRDKLDYIIPNIPVIPINFILKELNSELDSLYIKKEFWPKLRDYGILPENNSVRVIITSIVSDGKKIEVYPNRNVTE